jgi:hypothetical protein
VKIIFYDLLRDNKEEYQTSVKTLTVEGIAKILVASTTLIPASAKVAAEKGRWIESTRWMSAGDQFRIDLVKE